MSTGAAEAAPSRTRPSRGTLGWTTLTRFGFLRLIAGLGAIAMLCQTISASATAIAWSARAPLWWRVQLLGMDGGTYLLFTTGFALAAWGRPRLRRLGWGIVGLEFLCIVLWTWIAVYGEAP